MSEVPNRRCDQCNDLSFHLHGVDYDMIRPGCVLPNGQNGHTPTGTRVIAVDVFEPGLHHLIEPPLPNTPTADRTVVIYQTASGRRYDAWVNPRYADQIGARWPDEPGGPLKAFGD